MYVYHAVTISRERTGGKADRPPDWNSRTKSPQEADRPTAERTAGDKADRPKAVYPRKRGTPETPNSPRLLHIHV